MNFASYKKSVTFGLLFLFISIIILSLTYNSFILPRLKDRCEDIISDLIGINVFIEDINGGLYSGVNLIDIDSDYNNFKCKNIFIKINFLSLLVFDFELDKISINGLSVNHNTLNFLFKKMINNEQESSYSIKDVNVINSSIIYNDNKADVNFSVQLDQNEYLLAVDSFRYLDKDSKVQYASSNFKIKIDSNNVLSSDIIKIFDSDNNQYKIQNFNLSKSEFKFKFLDSNLTLEIDSKINFFDNYIKFSNIYIKDSRGYIDIVGNIDLLSELGTYKGEFFFDSALFNDYSLSKIKILVNGNKKFSHIDLSYKDAGFYDKDLIELDGQFQYNHLIGKFIFNNPFFIKSEKYSGDIRILDFSSFTNNKLLVNIVFDNFDLSKIYDDLNFDNQFALISGNFQTIIQNQQNIASYSGDFNIDNVSFDSFDVNNVMCDFSYSRDLLYDLSCNVSEINYSNKTIYDSVDILFNSKKGISINSLSNNNPINLNANLKEQILYIDNSEISLFGIKYFIKSNRLYTKNFNNFNIDNLYVNANDSELIFSGFYNPEAMNLNFIINNFNLSDFPISTREGLVNGQVFYENVGFSDSLYTNLSIDSFSTEFFNKGEINLELTGSNGYYEVKNINSIDNNNESFLNGTFSLPDINKIPNILSYAEDINLNVDINNFEIKNLSKYYYPKDEIKALLGFKGTISGSGLNPIFTGDVSVKNLYYKNQNIQDAYASLSGDKNGIYIDNMSVSANKNRAEVNGYFPLTTYGDKYDLKIKGKFHDIELFHYIDHIDSVLGEINFEIGVDGNYLNPIRNGSIEIKNATVYLNQIDNPIFDFNTQTNIFDNNILISNATCSLPNMKKEGLFSNSKKNIKKGDNININGNIDIADFYKPNFNISLEGQDIYIESTYNQIQGLINADLSIVGKDSIAIYGEVSPADNSFTIYELLSPISESYEQIESDYKISYNIHFPMDETIKVNTNDMNLILDGDIDIIKSFSDDNYQLIGRVNVIDGRFNFNGNNFKETNGYILFNPNDNTYIDIKSIATVIDEEINISFVGSLDDPNIILDSSSGTYSNSDILKMLAFKNSDDNIDSKDISSFFTDYIKNEIEKNIVRYSNLDEFQVVDGSSVSSNLNSINISMGKQLSNNLYMNLTYDVNNNNLSNYELNYRVNKNISIIGEVNDDDDTWQLKYRFKYQY